MRRLQDLTANLGQKLWITYGLGLFGLGLYLIVAVVLAKTLSARGLADLLNYGIKQPKSAMLWGFGFLLYFCVTLYVFRQIVKNVYRLWHSR